MSAIIPKRAQDGYFLKKYPTWIFGNSIDVLKRHHRFHLEPAFTNNWRKASASLKNQQESVGHTFAMDTKQKQTSGSKIANVLDKGHSVLVMESRKYTKAVAEGLRCTANQGNRTAVTVRVRSHLIGLLHVMAVFDATVDKKLASNPSNAKYVHHVCKMTYLL